MSGTGSVRLIYVNFNTILPSQPHTPFQISAKRCASCDVNDFSVRTNNKGLFTTSTFRLRLRQVLYRANSGYEPHSLHLRFYHHKHNVKVNVDVDAIVTCLCLQVRRSGREVQRFTLHPPGRSHDAGAFSSPSHFMPRLHVPPTFPFLSAVPLIFSRLCVKSTIGLDWTHFEIVQKNPGVNEAILIHLEKKPTRFDF